MPSFNPLLTVLALSSVGLSVVLPIVGTKHYDVAINAFSLTDSSHLDPFAKDRRSRSIMATAYTPVTGCRTKKAEPYMPPATATFQDDKFAAYGLPAGSFSAVELETCTNVTKAQADNSSNFPLVLFSGALATSRLIYNSMLQSVAATGYTVVSVDHPYDADFVEFPDGSNITAVDISSDAEIELALNTRVQDTAFLLREITNKSSAHYLRGLSAKTKVAMFGHSVGGATAAAALLSVPALSGALNLDGSMFGPILTKGTPKPFMLLGHENKTQATDPSWAAVWPHLSGWKAEYEVHGAAHYSFSDLPLVTAALGLQSSLPATVQEVLGSVEGQRMQSISVGYTTAFLDLVLNAGKDRELKKAGKKFPEVKKVA